MYNRGVVVEQPFWIASALRYVQIPYHKDNIVDFFHLELNEDEKTGFIIVPDGCASIVFEHTETGIRGCIAGTTLERAAEGNTKGKELYGVHFFPGELPACIKLPMSELTGCCIPLEEAVWDVDWVKRLQEQENLESWMELFLQKFKEEPLPSIRQLKAKRKQRIVSDVNQCVLQSGGLISVKELTEQLHYSERYIQEVYKERMGISPKGFAKIVRFQQALAKLEKIDASVQTFFETENGYYDQAHFSKEFKKNTGMTPKNFKKYIEEKDIKDRVVVRQITHH